MQELDTLGLVEKQVHGRGRKRGVETRLKVPDPIAAIVKRSLQDTSLERCPKPARSIKGIQFPREWAEKRFEDAKSADSLAGSDRIRELWISIDDVLIGWCWKEFGKETPIDLVSRNFTTCSQCKHAKVKGEPCVTCRSEGGSGWEGEDMVENTPSLVTLVNHLVQKPLQATRSQDIGSDRVWP